jgi:hypothetical protein
MTGDELPEEIHAAVDRLDAVQDRPAAEHVRAFEEVHRLLEGTLAELDGSDDRKGPAPGAGAGPHSRRG